MGSSGGGGGGGGTQVIQYAGYIESQHANFLATVAAHRNSVIGSSPFANYVDVKVEEYLFGVGKTLGSYATLFDIYGTNMLLLDIDGLWNTIYNDTVNSTVAKNLVVAEAAYLSDDIATIATPRLQTGMRDMNAVMGSTFVIGKAIIEDARTKAISKFSAETKYRLIPIAQARWEAVLQWKQNTVTVYAELVKFYYSVKGDTDETNYSMAAKNRLWPFTVLDFERAALGALQGAMNTKTDVAGASTAKKVIGGALSGAAMGAMVGAQFGKTGGPWGAGIGAVAGGIAGALS